MFDKENSCDILTEGLSAGSFKGPWAYISAVIASNRTKRKTRFMSYIFLRAQNTKEVEKLVKCATNFKMKRE
jgi:hypothetical protein